MAGPWLFLAYYRRLQNVCNRKVKSEKATAFLIWMILLFSVVRLTTISEQSAPRFCFSVAYILQSPVAFDGFQVSGSGAEGPGSSSLSSSIT